MLKALLRSIHQPIYKKRIDVLSRLIASRLRPGDRVLDVGCGSGALGAAIADIGKTDSLIVEGLENSPRGGEPIAVTNYDGGRFPFDDSSFDVVIVADVLHHEAFPDRLLAECRRVAKRLVIIKDHQLNGLSPGGLFGLGRECGLRGSVSLPVSDALAVEGMPGSKPFIRRGTARFPEPVSSRIQLRFRRFIACVDLCKNQQGMNHPGGEGRRSGAHLPTPTLFYGPLCQHS